MRHTDFVPLAPSTALSNSWTDTLLQCVQGMADNIGMSFVEALNMPLSFEQTYYKSVAWQKHKENLENKFKVQTVHIKQLNNVQKGIGYLLKR